MKLHHQLVTSYIGDDVGNKEELASISTENMEDNIINNEEVTKPNHEISVDVSNKDKLARPSDEMEVVDEQAKLEHVKDVCNKDKLSSDCTYWTEKKKLFKQDIVDNAMEGKKKDEIEGQIDGEEEEKLIDTEAPQEVEENAHDNAIELCFGHCANEDTCGQDETNPGIYYQLLKELKQNEDHDPTTDDICLPDGNPHDEEAICKYGTASGEQFQMYHDTAVSMEHKLEPEMYVENKAGVSSDTNLQGLHEIEDDNTVDNTGLNFENEMLNKNGDDVMLQMDASSKTDCESEYGPDGSQVDELTLNDQLNLGKTTAAETLGARTREYEHEFGCTSGEPFSELSHFDESISRLDAVTEDEVITESDWQYSPVAVDGLTVCADVIDDDIAHPVVKQIDYVSNVCVEESHGGLETIRNREKQTGIENTGIYTTNTGVMEFKSIQNTIDNIPVPCESLLHMRLEAMIIQCIDDAIKCLIMKSNSQALQDRQTSEQLELFKENGDNINEFVDYSSQELHSQSKDGHVEDKSDIVGNSICFADEFVSGDSNLENEETELDSSLIKYAEEADVEESLTDVSELSDLKSDMQEVLNLKESVCDFNSVTLTNVSEENTNNTNVEDKTQIIVTNRHGCESNQVVGVSIMGDKETIDETSNYVPFTDDESIEQPYEEEVGDIIANEGCRLDLHIFETTVDTDFTSPTDSEGHMIINAALSEDEDYHRIMSGVCDQDTESDMNDSLDLVPGSDIDDSGHNQCFGDGAVDGLDAGEHDVHLFRSCSGRMCMLLECL